MDAYDVNEIERRQFEELNAKIIDSTLKEEDEKQQN